MNLIKITSIFIFVLLSSSIADDSNYRVTESSVDKSIVHIITGFIAPYGLNYHRNNLYVSDLKANKLIKFSLDLKYQQELVYSDLEQKTVWTNKHQKSSIQNSSSLIGPHAVAFRSDGKLLIADYFGKDVKIYNSDGSFFASINGLIQQNKLKILGPSHVYVDQHDQIWVCDWDGNKIVKLSNDFIVKGILTGDSKGFVTGNLNHPSTNFKPHMLTIDEQGKIYVADSINHRIIKYDQNGLMIGEIGAIDSQYTTQAFQKSPITLASSLVGGFNGPSSVSIYKNKYLIVSDHLNNRIQIFNRSGKFLGWLGASENSVHTVWTTIQEKSVKSELAGGFSAPFNAFMLDDKLYVADGHNKRIQVFSPGLPEAK